MPIARLFDGTFSTVNDSAPYVKTSSNERYINKMHTQILESDFDTIKAGNSGLGNTELIGFDFDHCQMVSAGGKISQYDHPHISQKLPLLASLTEDTYKSSRFCSLFPNTAKQLDHSSRVRELLNGSLNYTYSMLMADAIKIGTHVNPDADRRAGDLIKLIYAVPAGLDGQHGSSLYSGTYLIRDIRHMFTGANYSQALTVVCDGYKESSRTDLVEWNNE